MKIKKLMAAAMTATMVTTAVPLSSVLTNAVGVAVSPDEVLERGDEFVDGNLKYEVNEDGTLCLYSVVNKDEVTSLEIPAQVKGKNVTSVAYNAFQGCQNLTSVTIPDGVSTFFKNGENYCFRQCPRLVEINISENNSQYASEDGVWFNKDKTKLIYYPAGKTEQTYKIPDSVTSIGYYAFNQTGSDSSALTTIITPVDVTDINAFAFSGCKSLKSITLSDNIVSIGGEAFSGCSGLESITIPESVTEIGMRAFRGCSSLTSITIPEGVTEIGNETFMACSNIELINLPSSVTDISSLGVFSGCDSLITINVDENNIRYSSENGVLFSEDEEWGKQLFRYPAGKTESTYAIPDGVTSTYHYAFDNCSGLKSIVIPESVTVVGASGYSEDSSEAWINLDDVYYSGSAEQWDKIEIYENNDKLKSAAIHYNCAPIDITDKNTGINASGILPNGAKLSVTPIMEQTTDTQYAYDLSFTDANGKEVQPESNVTVKIPVPEAFKDKKLYVYHVLDGKNIPIEHIVEDGMIVFSADHFSTFIISEKQLSETEEQPSEPEIVTPGDTDKNSGTLNGNDQASTGIALATAPVILTACAAVVIFKKKQF